MRLAADRGGVEQQLRAHQHHRARGFGIPLVPAHAHAQRRARPVPHLEAGIAGAEIEFLLISRPVRNMALAIDTRDVAVRPDHRQRVVMMRPVRLEEAGRDMHLQFGRQRLHRQHRLVLAHGLGVGEQPLVLDAAEIFALEQFGRQDHLRPPARRLAHQARHVGDVGIDIIGEGELQRSDGDLGHGRPHKGRDPIRHPPACRSAICSRGDAESCARRPRPLDRKTIPTKGKSETAWLTQHPPRLRVSA